MIKITLKEIYELLNKTYEEFDNITSYDKYEYFKQKSEEDNINIFNFKKRYKEIVIYEKRKIEDIWVLDTYEKEKIDTSNLNDFDLIYIKFYTTEAFKYWFEFSELSNNKIDYINKVSIHSDKMIVRYFYKDFKDFKSYKKGDYLNINATFPDPNIKHISYKGFPLLNDENYLNTKNSRLKAIEEEDRKNKKRERLVLFLLFLIIIIIIYRWIF
ncbi:hypothetical protein IMCC3317_38430 [Kordia antarctica]|uniref:Uncharacterized protein n=1 Tax=Kordia antarctica TaxID=1218801 RepID=A0A7L4ZPL4_9FLAO|nr:hypothetical protein [Kordia antarctica]QHI38450.1 hypothetical protein IMCC3317_38430 [Kordia antarctica]